jgi:hypothetical protein
VWSLEKKVVYTSGRCSKEHSVGVSCQYEWVFLRYFSILPTN